jgi:ferredoxin-NADP reductase/uncharacterized protein YcbX|tara:strand:+ start:511 stop:2403 length:1893 start_codon:yes stop_codon:yes gene_type:complete
MAKASGKLTATLVRIMRYPIKGFGGEEMNEVNLSKNKGLPHDRRWAIRNGSSQKNVEGWEPCQAFIRMTQHENLPLYQVENSDTSLYLRHPDGKRIAIQKNGDNADQLSTWFAHDDMDVSHSSEETAYWDHHDAHISIINVTTVRSIAKTAGIALDPQRFRGNLLIETAEPWSEFTLIGQRISIGDVELEILRPIDRCKATSVNPATGTSDINIPHLLSSQYGHIFCGVYARVVKAGKVEKNAYISIIALAPDAIEDGTKASTAPTPEQWPRPMCLVKRLKESHNVESFWLEDPLSSIIHAIAPASYLRLHVDNTKGPLTRSYTISQQTNNGRLLRISIKKETGDAQFSPWIHSSLQVGDTVFVSGPFVDPSLTWRPHLDPHKDILILTAGIGITIATSILFALKNSNHSSQINIAHSIKNEKDAALWEEVVEDTNTLKNATAYLFVTQASNKTDHENKKPPLNKAQLLNQKNGRITLSTALKNITVDNVQVFLCGPQKFGKSMHAMLIKKGINSDAIHEDIFYSPQSFVEPISKKPSMITPIPITFVHASGDISTMVWNPQHGSLLNTAEEHGISISANCRSGACRACLYAIEGEVENLTSPVSPAPKNWAYLCCAAPLSALTIKAKNN